MNPLLRVLLLLAASGASPSRIWSAFELEELPPEAFYLEGEPLWSRLGCSQEVQRNLRRLSEESWPEEEAERAGRNGVRLLVFSDREWPSGLSGQSDAPRLLYIKGKWPIAGSSVAVVGTRRCSPYGLRTAHEIGRAVGVSGGVVVSGGAAGVDRAAHEGCLSVKGPSIAVLGTGVDVVYPRGHEALFERLGEEGGALVSEYPLGSPPRQWRFPERNRIIASLSERLVVVEAPLKSGAMITARCALEAGREIWAVPGRINEEGCAGSNRLLYDGAFPLVSIPDFVSLAVGRQLSLFDEEARLEELHSVAFTEKEQRILVLLKKSGERTVDNLAVEGKMAPADVFSCLAALMAAGHVFVAGPGRWSAVPK
jgi:DNA processing protein